MYEEKADFFKLKNNMKQEIYSEIDAKYRFLEKMGLKDTLNKEFIKLTFKYSSVNEKERNDIRIHESIHSMSV